MLPSASISADPSSRPTSKAVKTSMQLEVIILSLSCCRRCYLQSISSRLLSCFHCTSSLVPVINLSAFNWFHPVSLWQDNVPLHCCVGLGRLCSRFLQLFYSTMLQNATNYSLKCTNYSLKCTNYSHFYSYDYASPVHQ